MRLNLRQLRISAMVVCACYAKEDQLRALDIILLDVMHGAMAVWKQDCGVWCKLRAPDIIFPFVSH